MAVDGKANTTPQDEKAGDDEQFLYASKQVKCNYILNFCSLVHVIFFRFLPFFVF